jgi:hypothetical protein
MSTDPRQLITPSKQSLLRQFSEFTDYQVRLAEAYNKQAFSQQQLDISATKITAALKNIVREFGSDPVLLTTALNSIFQKQTNGIRYSSTDYLQHPQIQKIDALIKRLNTAGSLQYQQVATRYAKVKENLLMLKIFESAKHEELIEQELMIGKNALFPKAYPEWVDEEGKLPVDWLFAFEGNGLLITWHQYCSLLNSMTGSAVAQVIFDNELVPTINMSEPSSPERSPRK